MFPPSNSFPRLVHYWFASSTIKFTHTIVSRSAYYAADWFDWMMEKCRSSATFATQLSLKTAYKCRR
jgi:hypothetical protein